MTRLLVDTHALLWWWTDDARLSAKARAAIADEANEVLVSAATAWEVATKHRLGKLAEVPQAAPRFAELGPRSPRPFRPHAGCPGRTRWSDAGHLRRRHDRRR